MVVLTAEQLDFVGRNLSLVHINNPQRSHRPWTPSRPIQLPIDSAVPPVRVATAEVKAEDSSHCH